MIKKSGFTLIELLVAITIFSFLIALATFSFRFYANLVKKLIMPYPNNAVMFSRLRDAVDSTFYYVVEKQDITGKPHFFLFFNGEPSQMEFITSKPLGFGGIALCKLYLTNDNQLILEESPIYCCKNNYKYPRFIKSDTKQFVVMKNVKALQISYLVNGRYKRKVNGKVPSLINVRLESTKDQTYVLFFKVASNFNTKKALTQLYYAPF